MRLGGADLFGASGLRISMGKYGSVLRTICKLKSKRQLWQ